MGVAPPRVFVTVKVTLLDVLFGESKVTSFPEAAQLAFTPSSWQLYATVVAPPVPVSVIVHVVPSTPSLKTGGEREHGEDLHAHGRGH